MKSYSNNLPNISEETLEELCSNVTTINKCSHDAVMLAQQNIVATQSLIRDAVAKQKMQRIRDLLTALALGSILTLNGLTLYYIYTH